MRLFDAHCDTVYEGCKGGADLWDAPLHLNLQKGSQYAPWCQLFAIFIPDRFRGDAALAHFDRCRDYMEEQLHKHADQWMLCRTGKDMDQAANEGKCAAILTVEGGAVIGGDLRRLRYIYDRGVRLLTLTWNGPNEIADGVLVKDAEGLTDFGRDAVRTCEDLGIVVDVSHIAEKGFWDVAEMARRPFIATHSNSKYLCSHPRNLTNKQFAAIRDKGGLVGLNFCPAFLRDALGGVEYAHMADIGKHLRYFLEHGGDRTVCLGSDFDGAPLPEGMEGMEDIKTLYACLRSQGFDEKTLDRVFFGNGWDFFKSALTRTV